MKSEADRLFTASRLANFGAEKQAVATKRMNVYAFLAETAEAVAKARARELPETMESARKAMASVALADLATLFSRALEAVGGNVDSNISHGLRFNLTTLHRVFAPAASAVVSRDDPTWDTFYAESRLTQPQLEAGWGVLTGRGGSTDLEQLTSAVVNIEIELRAAKSSTAAKTKTSTTKKIKVDAKIKETKRAEEDKKVRENSMPEQALVQAITSELAQGPDWDHLVHLLAPHAKALGGLDGVSRGSCVNAALLNALAKEALTSVSSVVAASDDVLRKLPSFTGIRVKKLRSICAAAVAEAEEELRIKNLHTKKVKATKTTTKSDATKDKKTLSETTGNSEAVTSTAKEKLEAQENMLRKITSSPSSRAASEPRAFTPSEARAGGRMPARMMTGRDSSTRTSSKSNLIRGRLSASPSRGENERASTASERNSRMRQQSPRNSIGADRSETRLNEARRERFAESPVKEAAQPTPRLLTKPTGSKLLAAMSSFNSGSGSSGVDAPSSVPPERQDNMHNAELGEIVTAPRASVSLGRLSSESFVAAAASSSTRHLPMGIGEGTARIEIGNDRTRSKGESRELSFSEGKIGSAF